MRQHFKFFEGPFAASCYLDSAATTQPLTVSLDAAYDWSAKHQINIGRAAYQLAYIGEQEVQKAKQSIASFLGCSVQSLVFPQNATMGANLLAYGLEAWVKKTGKGILTTDLEHHSNYLPWQQLAHRVGCSFDVVPVEKSGALDESRVCEWIRQKHPNLVAITAHSNVTGQRMQVENIIDAAHDVGAFVVVDACQAAAHSKMTDLAKADAIFGSAHKIYGPQGVGFLVLSEPLQECVPPAFFGGGMVADGTLGRWLPGVEGLSAGTQNAAGIVGFGAACAFLQKVGWGKLLEEEQCLLEKMCDRLDALESVQRLKVPNARGLVSFSVKGWHSHDVGSYLDSCGIAVRVGSHCAHPLFESLPITQSVRASLGVYSTMEDVLRLSEALEAFEKKFVRKGGSHV